MKSEVIRKRACNKPRRAADARSLDGASSSSPGESRPTSPIIERSPTLAPDSTTRISYDFDSDLRKLQNEFIVGAAASGAGSQAPFGGLFSSFPGPTNRDYLETVNATEPLPMAEKPASDHDAKVGGSPKRRRHEGDDDVDYPKKRRLSIDESSASEPPSSAISYGSLDGYASSTTSLSARSSMDFPFSHKPDSILRGNGGNTFLHPPMIPQDGPEPFHPPMQHMDSSFMDHHPPMLAPEELFSAFTNDAHLGF